MEKEFARGKEKQAKNMTDVLSDGIPLERSAMAEDNKYVAMKPRALATRNTQHAKTRQRMTESDMLQYWLV